MDTNEAPTLSGNQMLGRRTSARVLITDHGLPVHRKHNVTHNTEQQMTSETRRCYGYTTAWPQHAKLNRPICRHNTRQLASWRSYITDGTRFQPRSRYQLCRLGVFVALLCLPSKFQDSTFIRQILFDSSTILPIRHYTVLAHRIK